MIGRFESAGQATTNEQVIFFHHCHPVRFRISSLSRAHYTWSLYFELPTGAEEIADSTGFNLKRTVELYQVELIEVVTRIAEELEQNKSRKVAMTDITNLWKKARTHMKTRKSILKAIFPHKDVDLEFEVEIKNGLDLEIEQAQVTKEAKMYSH